MSGSVILVTGGSSGIGRACCARLNARGDTVYSASRSAGEPAPWQHLPLDVRDATSVTSGVADLVRREGRIDALIHAAGYSLAGAVEDLTIDEALLQLDTNYLGTVRTIRAVLPTMREAGKGRLILIGSIAGLIGLPFLGHYSASKFALDGLTQALRIELRPFGVEATVVHPGDVNTAVSANQIEGHRTGEGSPYAPRFKRTVAHYDANVRAGGSPDVVARAVERLLCARRMPVRLIVGSPVEHAAVGLQRIVPRRLFEAVVRKAYRL